LGSPRLEDFIVRTDRERSHAQSRAAHASAPPGNVNMRTGLQSGGGDKLEVPFRYGCPNGQTVIVIIYFINSELLLPLTPEQLCQRRGATFARLRMEAQLYCLRASATRLTGKYWAAPYAC